MKRIGFQATDEQKAWIEKKSKQTGESEATIHRQILQKAMKEDERK